MGGKVIREILAEFGVMSDSMRDEATLYADIGLDSTELVMLAVELKKRLKVEVQFFGGKDVTLAQLAEEVDRQVAAV